MVKQLLKKMVIGSPLEPLARAVYGWVSKTGKYDLQTLQVMDRVLKPNSNCIDVGCYKGDMLREMIRRSPYGRHFAFEPNPHQYSFIKELFTEIEIHNVALSSSTGEATFQWCVSSPALSGLARRECTQKEKVEELTVRTVLLDDMIPEDVHIDLIKVDVEGAEYQVFQGAVRTMARCRPVVVFEHGLGGADQFGTKPEQVFDLLQEECGLELSLMEDWLKGREPLTRKAFASEFNSHRNFYFMAHP